MIKCKILLEFIPCTLLLLGIFEISQCFIYLHLINHMCLYDHCLHEFCNTCGLDFAMRKNMKKWLMLFPIVLLSPYPLMLPLHALETTYLG
jgi:hypothetical protein